MNEAVNEPVTITFYCKDCRALCNPVRDGEKYKFFCDVCKSDNVAFGSEKAIKDFYHIKEK